MKKLSLIILIGLVFALFAVPSFAATTDYPMFGQTVVNPQGQPIGTVYDVIQRQGRIDYVVIDQNGTLYQIPYSDVTFQAGRIAATTQPERIGPVPNYAQNLPQGSMMSPANQAQGMAPEKASVVIGSPILNEQGQMIGRIEDLGIQNGQIQYVVVNHNGQYVQIPYSDLSFRGNQIYAMAPQGTVMGQAPMYQQQPMRGYTAMGPTQPELPPAELAPSGSPERVAQNQEVMNLLNKTVLDSENQRIGRVWDVRVYGDRIDRLVVSTPNGSLVNIPYSDIAVTQQGVLKVAESAPSHYQAPAQLGPREVPGHNPDLKQPWFGYWGGSGGTLSK